MIRVAHVVEPGPLCEEVRSIIRESGRLQSAPGTEPDCDFDASSLHGADVLVVDDSSAALERAMVVHALGVPVVVMTDDMEVVASFHEVHSSLALLPTRATAEELVAAIEATNAGLFAVHGDLAVEGEPPPSTRTSAPSPGPLTARELQVLHALAAGLANRTIATRLHISEHTAKFHVSQILAKLDAGSRAEAVSIAMRQGLLPL